MYPSSVFNCPAYSIPGNHDYIYDDQALRFNVELAYAAMGKSRWTMPSQFYRYTFPAVNPVLTVIALDSNIPYADGSTQSGAFTTMSDAQRKAQLAWLTEELAKPLTTPFLALAGHHPLYSDGPHGDNTRLIEDWDALLRKYNVHLYLAGHDHDLQHLEFEGHPTSFFCSGSGGAGLYALTKQETERGPYAQETFGFSHLEATAKLLTLRHVDSTGTVVHAFTKSPDNKVVILT
jgi:tartrate-resistant acid phosphatase type 5